MPTQLVPFEALSTGYWLRLEVSPKMLDYSDYAPRSIFHDKVRDARLLMYA